MVKHTKEFNKLQEEWYKKAKDSGFKDIEQTDGKLKKWSSRFILNHSDAQIEAKQEYYRAAEHFLNSYDFPNPTYKRVWELHSQGVSKKKIVAALRQEKLWYNGNRKDARPCDFSVQTIIESLRSTMMKKLKDER